MHHKTIITQPFHCPLEGSKRSVTSKSPIYLVLVSSWGGICLHKRFISLVYGANDEDQKPWRSKGRTRAITILSRDDDLLEYLTLFPELIMSKFNPYSALDSIYLSILSLHCLCFRPRKCLFLHSSCIRLSPRHQWDPPKNYIDSSAYGRRWRWTTNSIIQAWVKKKPNHNIPFLHSLNEDWRSITLIPFTTTASRNFIVHFIVRYHYRDTRSADSELHLTSLGTIEIPNSGQICLAFGGFFFLLWEDVYDITHYVGNWQRRLMHSGCRLISKSYERRRSNNGSGWTSREGHPKSPQATGSKPVLPNSGERAFYISQQHDSRALSYSDTVIFEYNIRSGPRLKKNCRGSPTAFLQGRVIYSSFNWQVSFTTSQTSDDFLLHAHVFNTTVRGCMGGSYCEKLVQRELYHNFPAVFRQFTMLDLKPSILGPSQVPLSRFYTGKRRFNIHQHGTKRAKSPSESTSNHQLNSLLYWKPEWTVPHHGIRQSF